MSTQPTQPGQFPHDERAAKAWLEQAAAAGTPRLDPARRALLRDAAREAEGPASPGPRAPRSARPVASWFVPALALAACLALLVAGGVAYHALTTDAAQPFTPPSVGDVASMPRPPHDETPQRPAPLHTPHRQPSLAQGSHPAPAPAPAPHRDVVPKPEPDDAAIAADIPDDQEHLAPPLPTIAEANPAEPREPELPAPGTPPAATASAQRTPEPVVIDPDSIALPPIGQKTRDEKVRTLGQVLADATDDPEGFVPFDAVTRVYDASRALAGLSERTGRPADEVGQVCLARIRGTVGRLSDWEASRGDLAAVELNGVLLRLTAPRDYHQRVVRLLQAWGQDAPAD